jgi:hypothetical protein
LDGYGFIVRTDCQIQSEGITGYPVVVQFMKRPSLKSKAKVEQIMNQGPFVVRQGNHEISVGSEFCVTDRVIENNKIWFSLDLKKCDHRSIIWLVLQILRIGHEFTPISRIHFGEKHG